MSTGPAVVVTDISSPSRFLRCLREVVDTVPREVEVIAVSTRGPVLPPPLARRVRRVSVRKGSTMADVVTALVTEPRLVVVVRSDCRVSGEWLPRLRAAAAGLGSSAGAVGGTDPYLLVFPELVRSSDVPRLELPRLPGVGTARTPDGQPEGSAADPAEVPTISASLIVKDEAAVITRCIEAVRPLVDEVVVYDTGSQDETRALAAAAGARVVTGYWDDDFGAARNRALEHCTGDWILQVDADETVDGDADSLRTYLARQTADLAQIALVNATWDGGQDGQQFLLARLFRRRRCHWAGALHEMIVPRDGQPPLAFAAEPAPLRAVHTGYALATIEAKGKIDRNLRIAEAAIENGDDSSSAWCNLGRTYLQAGRYDDALEALGRCPDRAGPDTIHVLAGRAALTALLRRPDRSDEVELWFDVLSRHGESRGAMVLRRALFAVENQDFDLADELLQSVPDDRDVWGLPVDPYDVELARISVSSRRRQPAAVWEGMARLAAGHPDRVPLRDLLVAALRSGHTYDDVVAVVPPKSVDRSLRECLYLDPVDADRWLDAVWTSTSSPASVVAASFLAFRLGFERALEWELRAVQAGVPDAAGPLGALSAHADVPLVHRVLAAAVRWEVLGRDVAEQDLRHLVSLLTDDEWPAALELLEEYAPQAAATARDVVAGADAGASSAGRR